MYMRGTETATSLIDTTSERENGDINETALSPRYSGAAGVDTIQERGVRTVNMMLSSFNRIVQIHLKQNNIMNLIHFFYDN